MTDNREIVGWFYKNGRRIPVHGMKLEDDNDFDQFIQKNLGSPQFKKFGQENGLDAVKMLWLKNKYKRERRNVHEIDIEEALSIMRENIPSNVMDGWFRNGDSGYKWQLLQYILNNEGVLNAGLNIAYRNYTRSLMDSAPMPFEKWLRTPQTMYRGGRSRDDDFFFSYTPDKTVAQKFANNGAIQEKQVRPIDTLGSYQTTGEYEFLVWRD